MSFYVSPSGSDSNPGTQGAPFASLTHAQSVVRGSADKTVTLRGGTYTLSSNWQFDGSDSGETWIPYVGETAVIDGNSRACSIVATHVSNWTMNGLTFQNMGASGGSYGYPASVLFEWGSNVTMRWNNFIAPLDHAIQGFGVQGLTIEDNTIDGQFPGNRDAGQGYSAIDFNGGTQNGSISHNLIQNCQGGGVSFSTGTPDPPNTNMTVDRNLMINVCTSAFDYGCLYSYDTNGGSTIRFTNNRVKGYGSGSRADLIKGIYLDWGASNTYSAGNIISGSPEWAIQINGGVGNIFENNIFDFNGGSFLGIYQHQPPVGSVPGGMAGNEFRKSIVYSSDAWPNPLWADFRDTGENPPNVHNNLFYSVAGGSVPGPFPGTSTTVADPQFTNAAGYDYSMPGTSPFFTTVGGTAFATDQGPRTNPYAAAGAPIINSFTATPSSVSASGVSTTLSWNTAGDNITSITLTPAGGSAIPVTALTSYSVAVTGTLVYTLAVTNTIGTTRSTLTVSIATAGGSGSGIGTGGTGGTGGAGSGSGPTAPTIASYTSTATTLTSGGSATLNWTITGTTTAVYLNGALQTGSSATVSPTVTTAYSLLVVNGTSSNSQSITITVLSESPENIEYHQVRQGDRSGGGTQFQMTDASGAPGKLASYLADRTLTAITVDPSLLSSDGLTLRIPASSLAAGIYGQQPRGTLNGSNRFFRLDYTPASVYMWLVKNGTEQRPPVDGGATNPGYEYAIRGAEIEYTTAPIGTDWHYVKYFINAVATPPHRLSATAYLTTAHYPDVRSSQWGGGAGFNDVVSLFSLPTWYRDASTYDKRTDAKLLTDSELASLDAGTLYLLMEQFHLGNIGASPGFPWDDEFWIYDAYIVFSMSDGTTQVWRPTTYETASTVNNPQNAVDQDPSTYAVILATEYSSGGYDGSAMSLRGWARAS